MDEYQIMSLLTQVETTDVDVDVEDVPMLYAEKLAEVAERLTQEEMQAFLIFGAYLCKVSGKGRPADAKNNEKEVKWKGNTQLN
jgi:hypothetical protein